MVKFFLPSLHFRKGSESTAPPEKAKSKEMTLGGCD